MTRLNQSPAVGANAVTSLPEALASTSPTNARFVRRGLFRAVLGWGGWPYVGDAVGALALFATRWVLLVLSWAVS